MIRKIFHFSILILITAALCACARFHPIKSAPTRRDQCIALNRKMLFLPPGRTNDSEWTTQARKRRYELAYKKLNCNIILRNNKHKIKKHN